MKYRCVMDDSYSGYCAVEPKWKQSPKSTSRLSTAVIGGTCRLNPKTCGKHLTWAESLAKMGITSET